MYCFRLGPGNRSGFVNLSVKKNTITLVLVFQSFWLIYKFGFHVMGFLYLALVYFSNL